MGTITIQKPDSVIKQEGMRILLDGLGKVDAVRFISLVMKEPIDYTDWQQTLFEELSLDELSQKAMDCYEEKKIK